tara:strand:- start:415 stop:1650 length:1236 start_codon:yes stop_codon:yes gene_type:complete
MKTNLKNHLIEFSQGWEDYVNECMRLKDDKIRFYTTKHHPTYRLIKTTLVSELEALTDKRLYKIKGSVGQTGLSGIPWISILDKEATESTQKGFYISYLFSRNAKKLYLSIALGATQFENLYGKTEKATKKIITAKKEWVRNFAKYAPFTNTDDMDLIDSKDSEFVREFSKGMYLQADRYSGGSFFTKTYDLVNPNFSEEDFINDLKKYVDSYRQIVKDPLSSILLETLDESVFEESDKKQNLDLNYELPSFNPDEISPKIKGSKKSSTEKPRKPSPPSKKVGDAGEKYVYEYEKNRLTECGKKELSELIVKQYEDLSFFPGYDIQSFDEEGNEIYIEVKSTKSKKKDSFEISENEINAARELGDAYYIYQVTNALTNPKISTVIQNPIRFETLNKILVEPMVHRVTFKQK